ncbi:VOC family protein [Demetria terragena]|uniref:VOC family protein n=1 Tax=Demetria terragena TaxID=63959 RepID=UPI0003728412|nr:VOC family protein [Demetria terragena]
MSTRQLQITIDARDPRALSALWREALGYVFPPPPGVELEPGERPLTPVEQASALARAVSRPW